VGGVGGVGPTLVVVVPTPPAWAQARSGGLAPPCLLAACLQKQRLLASKLPPHCFGLVTFLQLAVVIPQQGDLQVDASAS